MSATVTTNTCDVAVTQWKDNAVVTIESTVNNPDDKGSVSRCSRTEKKRIKVPTPNSIQIYNQNMGGANRMDQNINCYRVGIRGKKWWWCLFTWLLDAALQNAWQLSKLQGADVTQLDFLPINVKSSTKIKREKKFFSPRSR